jgi:uroporphyrinogen decarboxylase
MRQAGRYMAAFRAYSDRIPFRERSETAAIAVELSLQPWRAFKPDGVIMFSDILTPLPALGVEFDVVKGKGPVIAAPLRSKDAVGALTPLDDPDASLPFIRSILSSLRAEVGAASTVLGFVGAPWTLAAYAIEGKADKHCLATKTMMRRDPALLHAVLAHFADAMAVYVVHQIDCGAQVVQLFDSWAHHLTPDQYAEFSLPYSERVVAAVKAARPATPLILHANGGTGKAALLATSGADVVGLDWGTTMAESRAQYGAARTLAGNVDPVELFGGEAAIEAAVRRCLTEADAGGRARGRHILNVGHGVAQGTPEDAVAQFCDLARASAGVLGQAAAVAV